MAVIIWRALKCFRKKVECACKCLQIDCQRKRVRHALKTTTTTTTTRGQNDDFRWADLLFAASRLRDAIWQQNFVAKLHCDDGGQQGQRLYRHSASAPGINVTSFVFYVT